MSSICFVSGGKPSRGLLHPDYVPSLFCFKSTPYQASAGQLDAVRWSALKQPSTPEKNVV